MAIKDLAICYNGSANADSALQYAIQMCKKYDATLTGLFVKSPVRFEGQVERWISDDVLKSVKNAEREVSQDATSTHENCCNAWTRNQFSGRDPHPRLIWRPGA